MADIEARRDGGADLHIDCGSCSVRGLRCGQCVVSVLLGRPGIEADLDSAERTALVVLADGGLVPPLLHVVADNDELTSAPPRRAAFMSRASEIDPGRAVS